MRPMLRLLLLHQSLLNLLMVLMWTDLYLSLVSMLLLKLGTRRESCFFNKYYLGILYFHFWKIKPKCGAARPRKE